MKHLVKKVGRLTHRFSRWLKTNQSGALFGLVFGLAISACVWGLAYFGYINIGLPAHFNYQERNRQFAAAIPKGYYISRMQTINNFRAPGTNSVLLVASNKKYLSDTSNTDLQYGDILYIFDQAGGNYAESFKYEPYEIVKLRGQEVNFGYTALQVRAADINHDGRNELIVGWSHIGADAQSSIPMVFKGAGNTVRLTTLQQPDAGAAYPKSTLRDGFNRRPPLTAYPVQGFFVGANGLLTYEISSLVCEACTDENKYTATQYEDYNDKLSPQQSYKFDSLQLLNEYAANTGYQ